ncbi:hypothetical protein HY636_00855 [Candidatus Woesearchaeota archaeon]|nr:hypothetical protein [Candidatus Woesearchaeota archaeon]
MFEDKRGVTPLMVTIVLIGFAVAVGSIIMSLGGDYVKDIPDTETSQQSKVVCVGTAGEPLKDLMVKYINDEITVEQYLQGESILNK